jgi:putative CocE/NonD family hydrolase
VRLIEINSGTATCHPSFPQPTGELALHLAAGGRLAATPDTEDSATPFRYDPADPTPSVGGATNERNAGAADNTELEKRPDVITFTTEPLGSAVQLLGSPVVELAFGSDRTDTAVFVRLCEVTPDGRSTNLTDRLVRLQEADRDAEGGWSVSVSLPPTCARIAAASRLRLQVSSGAYPRFLRHPGTAENPFTAKAFHPAQQVVHHGPSRGGSVRLPLRSAAAAVASAEDRHARA